MRVLIAIAVLVATPAAAEPMSPTARAALDAGRPYVDVRASGSSGTVRAGIDIPAPRDAIWRVMTDCALATKMSPSTKTCRVLERDPQGRWDVREQVSRRSIVPPIRNVYRQDYDGPDRIRFRRTAGDLKVFEGEWRLVQIGDQVRVTYEARVTAAFAVPGWAASMVLRHEIPLALEALRRESIIWASKSETYASARGPDPRLLTAPSADP